jgi:hypothetical protein
MRTTDPRTGVSALLVNAGQVGGTLLVDCTLRLALNIGIALEARKTLARGSSVSVITNCIVSTGRRVAGVDDFRSVGGS